MRPVVTRVIRIARTTWITTCALESSCDVSRPAPVELLANLAAPPALIELAPARIGGGSDRDRAFFRVTKRASAVTSK